MREVEVSRLTDVIEKLCIEANEHLPESRKNAPSKHAAHAKTERLPRVSLTILLRILILQITRTCRSARIQEWHVYSLK